MKNVLIPLAAAALFLASCSGGNENSGADGKALSSFGDTLLPAYQKMKDLEVLQLQAHNLASAWTVNQHETPSKAELRNLVTKTYPELKSGLQGLTKGWSLDDKTRLDAMFKMQDSCIMDVSDIMAALNDSAAYEDADLRFQVRIGLADDRSELNRRSRDAEEKLKALLGIVEPRMKQTLQSLGPKKQK